MKTDNNAILKNASKAFKLEQELKSSRKTINELLWKTAEILYEFYNDKLYKLLDYESLESYLAQPDLSVPETQAGKLMLIYRDIVLKYKLKKEDYLQLDPEKLSLIWPLVNNGLIPEIGINDWLQTVSANSYTDIKVQVDEIMRKYYENDAGDKIFSR